MVKGDDLNLIVRATDIDGLPVTNGKVVFRLFELRTQSNIRPTRLFQGAIDRERVHSDNSDDFQCPLLTLRGTIVGVIDRPLSQLRRIENRFAPRHHSGQGLTALGHGDLGAIVGNHMNLGRRTFLAESVQSVIHRGVGLAQFQGGLRSVFQQRFLAQCGADYITPSGVQRNVHGGGTSQKLTAPLVKGFRHCGRSL